MRPCTRAFTAGLAVSAVALAHALGLNCPAVLANGPNPVDDSYFEYEYDKVYDYYIINAWFGLDEPVPAYTPQMVERHTALVGALPWVTPTLSGSDQFVLGQSAGWPANPSFPNDAAVPPHNIYGYQITDPNAEGPKTKVILASGNHATEFTGNWVLEGMVNFLAGSDPRAEFLRSTAVFFVYPDVNPDGRYQAVHRINFEAAPDPNAGTNLRKRGSPELYAAGQGDHNRIWTTSGQFSTIDTLVPAMQADTGGGADYLWDMHGPQEPANWRSPSVAAAVNEYAAALLAREPDVLRCGPPGSFKRNVAGGPPGKLSLWAGDAGGGNVLYPYVYEPGGWTEEWLKESGRNLALAFYDVLGGAPPPAPRAELVGHWTFNGHFDDAVAGHHATAPTPPSGSNNVYAPAGNGKIGGAAVFDGSMDALAIPKEALTSSTFTITFWEFSPAESTNDGYFLSAGTGNFANSDIFLRRFTRDDDQGTLYAGRITEATFGDWGPISRGQWHFNAVTLDADGIGRWYVDGQLVRGLDRATFNGLTQDLWLGNNRGVWNRHFEGMIDDLGIWDEALPAERVRAIYNLANRESLNYHLGQAQELFNIFDAGPGNEGVVGGEPWRHVSNLGVDALPGTVLEVNGWDTLILGGYAGSRTGVQMIPEPGTWLLLLSAVACRLLVRRRR